MAEGNVWYPNKDKGMVTKLEQFNCTEHLAKCAPSSRGFLCFFVCSFKVLSISLCLPLCLWVLWYLIGAEKRNRLGHNHGHPLKGDNGMNSEVLSLSLMKGAFQVSFWVDVTAAS